MHSRVLQRGCAEFRAEHIIFHTKSLSEYKCYKSGFLNVLRYFCSVAHLLASSYTLRKVLALIFSRHEIRTKINSTETTQSDSSLSVVGEKKSTSHLQPQWLNMPNQTEERIHWRRFLRSDEQIHVCGPGGSNCSVRSFSTVQSPPCQLLFKVSPFSSTDSLWIKHGSIRLDFGWHGAPTDERWQRWPQPEQWQEPDLEIIILKE